MQSEANPVLVSKLKALLLLVLTCLIAWWLAQITLLFMHPAQVPVVLSQNMKNSVDSASVVDSSSVASWHLFGEAVEQEVVVSDQIDAPETQLRLTLLGVFSSSDPAEGSAVVAEQGRGGDLYLVGATLPGNATLEAVYSDRVLLKRRGQLETLRFDEKLALMSQQRTAAPAPVTTSRAAQSVRANANDMLNQVAQSLSENPALLRSELGLVVQKKNGLPAGYKVGRSAPPEFLQQTGLRKGDVILSVNGQPLGDPSLDQATIEQVRQAGQAIVEVRRGRQTFQVPIPL